MQTPWDTYFKVELTDKLIEFAVNEFNYYPKFLAAQRTRPWYAPENKQWPPKWVNETGRKGPMKLDKKGFIKFLMIFHLLGVKGLGGACVDEMFSKDPVLREEWLCKCTNRNDFQRFLRQVCVCVVCAVLCHTWPGGCNLAGLFFLKKNACTPWVSDGMGNMHVPHLRTNAPVG